jgi:SulP family sulfate permease
MTGDRHNSNVELVAQGIANMLSPLFGAYQPLERSLELPPTSAPSQTIAGIVHALTLLTILLVAAPSPVHSPRRCQPSCWSGVQLSANGGR